MEKTVLDRFNERARQREFYRYRPYGHADTLCPDGKLWKLNKWESWTNKPWQMDFHNSRCKEKANICANGVGKSYATLWETTAHILGEYPDWYDGVRFDKPVHWWVCSIDASMQVEGVQKILLGADLDKNLGTGMIPGNKIVGKPKTKQSGVPNTVHQITVKGKFGYSTIIFKTYQQGWKSFQTAKPDGITLDEQPDDNDNNQRRIFEECQTRIFRSGGIMLAGLTPLLGETDLTRHFMSPKTDGILCVTATWDDVAHLKEEDKARLRATYPAHALESRTMGTPMMGEGRVIDAAEDEYKCNRFELPKHFSRICGIDFGVGAGHPTAMGWLAHDRDRDIVFLYDEFRKENVDSANVTLAWRQRGDWIPVAWPHDGHKTSDLTKTKADGNEIKDKYIQAGMNMLPISARYKKDVGGAQAQEPIIEELNDRIRTGRFIVFSDLQYFFEEARSFHRKDGRIINRREDMIKAVLYGLMMIRYAYTEPSHRIHTNSHFRGLKVG